MKRLVILGGGESGVGTAILGKKQGYKVFVSDYGTIKTKYRDVLKNYEIEWEDGGHTEAKILNADLIMKSPGIPDKATLIQKLVAAGIPVISEIEFASRYTNATLVGITGSNGKTTTTLMMAQILKQAGFKSVAAGNIGDSFARWVALDDQDYYALEISSFQLDGIVDFAPHIAILTNITPDHLDRYEYKFENYIRSKFRIAENQTENDYLIYDADDEVIADWLEKHRVKAKLMPFSITKQVKQGAFYAQDEITIITDDTSMTMSTKTMAIKGQHNTKNAMAAATAAKLLSIRKATIRESLEGFQGAEHRLEHVLKINHVSYINDSKATNVNATFYALDSMSSPTVWIVGGVDKGNDYKDLFPLVNEKVKAIICLGKDNSKLLQAFGNMVETIVETQFMSEAVKIAYKLSEKGDSVLLSPACASFDLFENYEDRGRQFKEAVRNL
ncbi:MULTISPECIES: UDP-N-acetylmuramoyl-L-alanine--D-glutamate ligase [unclassified Leeuwenhoekiella]|uniref:UDP-N-acetylmuramoyl-L-alanine--D-glutamate ligase n=1 Tax=unclassified Leeuwenhoekiella TaxID=2615029 RepID=UPI000C434258|nr:MULTISPECIES: UDP-N-acetylmuramoyl-L-alanine--D-glutamate ligase [unclassified Leeuwenhoekiella]MAW96499.1 UDP-N-acetylmuramoyl-L-alanine--D-glutamate ligase [Leeuwenhoekiella sp.]MBA81386.1 UDP-N-acetylmuramoyl-L-alanine--D-glutamate ligase [Leeuwenhoekiella sp.]|tara:strand:+ start:2131 stop:3465 length:1335 start_codon:yes stop_codon:yes gene_type:complete